MIMRKIEKVKDDAIEYGVSDVIIPKRSTKFSAGYDICSPIDVVLAPGEIKTVWTNIKAQCNNNECILLFIRSSMGRKGITLANSVGLIDADYYSNENNDGNIGVALKNNTSEEFRIKKNEKIAQLVFVPYLTVDEESEITNVRSGGYGSTN